MSIEKLWISSPRWQRWCSTAVTMMDVHSIASTGRSCSLITVRYIYCCCQYHHSFHWLIVFVYWCCFKSSGCCRCYCLLRPADWPVDCWSTSVFLLLPLCFAIVMATCCVARAVADDVLSKMGNAMFVDSTVIVDSVVDSIVVGTPSIIVKRFFSWHVRFSVFHLARTISSINYF